MHVALRPTKVATIRYICDGPTDEGRLTRDWHAEYRSNPATVAHFARRSAGSLKPFRKIHEFDFVFHADVCNGNLDYIEALRNARYPLISPDGRQPLCNRFVQSGGRHLDGMRYPIQVPDRYAARADWHTAKISYSPFIRHMVLLVVRSRVAGRSQRLNSTDTVVGQDFRASRGYRRIQIRSIQHDESIVNYNHLQRLQVCHAGLRTWW
jgi:hypothetical protein